MLPSKAKILLSAITITALIATLTYLSLLWFTPISLAAEAERAVDPSVLRWGYMAAALATALSALAAGIAVASVGAAAIGAVAEKPELFGRTLVFVGLAEGIAIYGLIISIMILNRLG